MPGRFQEIRWLAAGGMAEVVLVSETGESGVARTLVLKRVLPHLRNEVEFLRMFANEARLAMQLRHPNIVRVVASGRDESVPFIAMEALYGADVRTLLSRVTAGGSPVSIRAACGIVAGAARGLHYAHTLRDATTEQPLEIVHRDVSPHNLFVTRAGELKILDFGIAKSALQLTQTQSGVLKGKFRYMAPEQIRSVNIDARVDVFALGVVLWELLTGTALWKRENEILTANAILHESVERPSSLRKEVPEALDRLVMSMLAKFPTTRPASGEAVADALERIAGMLPADASMAHALRELVATLCPETANADVIAVSPDEDDAVSQPATDLAERDSYVSADEHAQREGTGVTPALDHGAAMTKASAGDTGVHARAWPGIAIVLSLVAAIVFAGIVGVRMRTPDASPPSSGSIAAEAHVDPQSVSPAPLPIEVAPSVAPPAHESPVAIPVVASPVALGAGSNERTAAGSRVIRRRAALPSRTARILRSGGIRE